jgi:nitrate reductase gamma subunit
MGILLALSTYAVLGIFLVLLCGRLLTSWKAARIVRGYAPSPPFTPCLVLKVVGDILFLSRLLRTNDLLWIGEWLFHCTFPLVVLRHLVFFLNPVPEWVGFLQPFGIFAGYVLPLSLIYIFTVKLSREKGYFPSYNFFLLILLLLLSMTGILLRTVFKPDLVAVKGFVLGILGLSLQSVPLDFLFVIHFSLVLVFILYLPTHIFAAPLVMLDARQREEELRRVMHGEKR